MQNKLLRRLACLLVLLLCAAAIAVELYGGSGVIPTWGQLHTALGLDTGTPDTVQTAAGECSVTFFDVGQGDAVLISQNGEYCLIDAGPYDARDELAAALDTAGVSTLKYLVMTHPHSDHIGGMPTLLQSFEVEALLLPDLDAAAVSSATLDSTLRLAEKQGSALIYAEDGLELELGEGVLTVLSCGVAAPENSDDDAVNDLSLCLRYTFDGFSFLDTGDAEALEEQALAAQYGGRLKSTLFKGGHHGSASANTQELLAAVQPCAVVVSCGLDNDYGHPHASVLRRYAEKGIAVYRTDRQGTITAQWQAGQLLITTADGALAPAA